MIQRCLHEPERGTRINLGTHQIKGKGRRLFYACNDHQADILASTDDIDDPSSLRADRTDGRAMLQGVFNLK